MERHPKIGEIVHYHITPEATFPGIISAVEGDGTVCLSVFVPGGTEHPQGVPFREAPTEGCWGWPPSGG